MGEHDQWLLPALDGAFGDRADAISVDGRTTDWATLSRCAGALGARLKGAQTVALKADASLETIVAVTAALVSGVAIVPIPADSGPDERGHILSHSGAELVLGDHGWTEVTVESVPIPRPGQPSPVGDGNSTPVPISDAPAVIMYTSGTTGPPKGVVLSQRAIAADLDALAEAWQWTTEDTLVHGLPLFHVHGLLLGVLGALRTGSRLVHTGRPTPQRYAAADGSLYFGVPTIWSRVCADEPSARALRSARLLVSGSAPLSAPTFAAIEGLCGQRPLERYGMTETLITLSTRADGERRPGSVGLPLEGVTTRIVDDHGETVADDGETVGALEVRSPTLYRGYLDNPGATADALTGDGWFRTGDAAIVEPDGFHRIVGRQSTDLIKSGGFRIGAGEIEDALLGHPGVREAAVVGMPDADLGQCIVAFVVADRIAASELGEYVAQRLSVHKRPRRVHLVEALPRNAMGKLQKGKLTEP